MKRFFPIVLMVLVLVGFAAHAALNQNVAGKVSNITGSALAVQNAQVRVLKTGDEILIGDILSTGPDSRLEIAMIDDGRFKLGAQTSFVVVDYTFGQGNDNVVMELLNGAMDGVSGQIAKTNPDGMKIKTPTATIGIRGTKFFVGEIEKGILSVAHWSGGGVLVKNFAGEVFLKDNDTGTHLTDENTAPSAPEDWSGAQKKRALALVD